MGIMEKKMETTILEQHSFLKFAGGPLAQRVAMQVSHDMFVSALVLLMRAWHPAVVGSQAMFCHVHVAQILFAFP